MKKVFGFLLGFFLLFQGNAFASMISDGAGLGYDQASHSTARWQRLGESSAVDDGVTWSANGGIFGNESLSVGDTVTFKFSFWHQGWGLHNYDQLKVWFDTDVSDQFTGSTVYAFQHFKNAEAWGSNPTGDALAYAEANYAYYSYEQIENFIITEDMLGGLFLRARVHCNHEPWDTIKPTGGISQGEVEDYSIAVNPIPEPATMSLFGLGLLGLAGVSRRKNNTNI
ncbi:MAG: PEP-CTERM sorting domain-containing protein [Pseudomonadota bacterium]